MRSRVLRSRFRERVVVTLHDGRAFGGILYSCDDKALVLRGAEALGAGENGAALPLDGEIICLLSTVSYIQRP